MKKSKKLSSFDFTDDLKKKDLLLIKGGRKDAPNPNTNCSSATCNGVC